MGTMLAKLSTDTVLILVGVASALLIALFAFEANKTLKPSSRWEGVLDPKVGEQRAEEQRAKSRKGEGGDKGESRKKKALAARLESLARKKKWDDKISLLYSQAGIKGKGFSDFVRDVLKGVLLGAAMGGAVGFMSGNALIGIFLFLVMSAFKPVGIISKKQKRTAAFEKDFPFFLRSLSFVLQNGATLAGGFAEVVDKMQGKAIRDVMTEVLNYSKTSGGDFSGAFDILPKLVKSNEANDFVETIRNNLGKGIPVAATLSNQSTFIERMHNASHQRKVNNIDNKILIPIMATFLGIALIIMSGLSF